jgi:hypothetical protein
MKMRTRALPVSQNISDSGIVTAHISAGTAMKVTIQDLVVRCEPFGNYYNRIIHNICPVFSMGKISETSALAFTSVAAVLMSWSVSVNKLLGNIKLIETCNMVLNILSSGGSSKI